MNQDRALCCEETEVHEDAVEQVRSQLPQDEVLYDLAELFKIFGDSTRVKILYALLEAELCVCDIAKLMDVSQSAVSHQLRVQQAGEIPPGGQDSLLLPGRRARLPHFEPGHGAYSGRSGDPLSRAAVSSPYIRTKIQYFEKGAIVMKKTFKMIDLDCANCAAKMEAAIKKIDGVQDATVSFMTQKLTIQADDARFDAVVQEAVKACKKVEPDCEIVLK